MKFVNMSVDELHALGKAKHEEYTNGDPFPNIYFDNFFNPEMLEKVLAEFPDMSKKPDLQYNDPNQVKLASKGEYRFGEVTKDFAYFLNSQSFLEFLTNLTGIKALIPDPYFEGAGCHQILPGGLLRIHADFNKQKLTNLDRRLNVLVYLNKDWDETWGGHFELWDTDMKGCRKRILPVFNRMAIFSTTSNSYHGHPDPLKCPEDRSRKSFALYYYTNGRPEEEVVDGLEYHSTIFKARPGMAEKVEDREPITVKSILRDLTPPIIVKGIKKIIQ
jgi:Rps23 Pro-64 3,4-dihydroxylase Tpa1-like proline 4-hydroxylase